MNAIFPRNKLKTSTINIIQTTSSSPSQPMITKKAAALLQLPFHMVLKPTLSDCISQCYLFIGRKLSGLHSKTSTPIFGIKKVSFRCICQLSFRRNPL